MVSVRPLCEPCQDYIKVVLRLITGRVALEREMSAAGHGESVKIGFDQTAQYAGDKRTRDRAKLTDTALPRISLKRISLMRSSTLIAPGRSFLFASTSNGTVARAGRARRACNSDVAVDRDFCCK